MIDWEVFNEYKRQFGNTTYFEVIEIFVKGYPQNISVLQKSVENNDFDKIKKIAHDLKTNCAYMGDNESRKLAFNLELMGDFKEIDNTKLKIKLEGLSDNETWNRLENMAKNQPENTIGEVFDQFLIASGNLIKELEQYIKIHFS